MKRRTNAILAAALAAVLLLGGCGSSSGEKTASGAWSASAAPAEVMDNGWSADAAGDFTPAESSSKAAQTGEQQAAKRIYTAEMTLETTEFDRAHQALLELTEQLGGYMESGSVGEYGGGYRHADLTVRVPAEQFEAFLTQAGQLCHVTWQSTSCQDVSEFYYDTAGRLATQRTKLARLQELLARAESMEDIITLESAISDAEGEIESLSGELQHYDALVDYSMVNLSLEEVYRLSEAEETATGFPQRLGQAVVSGWHGFTVGLEELAVSAAYHWVWLVAAAIVAAGIVRGRKLRRKARKSVPTEDDKG